MAKKKKTREQKILADASRRDQLSAQYKYTFTPSVDTSNELKVGKFKSPIRQDLILNNSYINLNNVLIHDLKKTSLITIIILGLQIFLRIILK